MSKGYCRFTWMIYQASKKSGKHQRCLNYKSHHPSFRVKIAETLDYELLFVEIKEVVKSQWGAFSY